MIAFHKRDRSWLPARPEGRRWRGVVSWFAWWVLCVVWAAPGDTLAGTWTIAGLSFSDELGGVRLVAASGTGRRDDPIVLIQEIAGAGPGVLVVRNDRSGGLQISPALGLLRLAVVSMIANRGPWAWSGFDLELRRAPDQPSVYTDGLSFDQPQSFARLAKADRFLQTVQDDEPFDRIRFDGGKVDPTEVLRLDFDIVDVNGATLFYLVQQPIVLFARRELPAPQWLALLGEMSDGR